MEQQPQQTSDPCSRASKHDNDVEIVNQTVPEIYISDNSCESAYLTATDKNTISIEIKKELLEIERTNEKQCFDFVVLDEDKSCEIIKEEDLSLHLIKVEVKSESEPKTDKTVNETKIQIAKLKVEPEAGSKKSNESAILQLGTSNWIDSYIDKTKASRLKSEANKQAEDDINTKEIDSIPTNTPVKDVQSPSMVRTKVAEADSLILTADEELETEMSATEKNEKAVNANDKKNPTSDIAEKPKPGKVQKDLETKPPDVSADVKADAKTEVKKAVPPKKSDAPRTLWVSNITQSVKATDLKQFISKVGKVVTAKVVTDGKKCYGYIVMENPNDANECLKSLNNAHFEGKKISLSFTRPPKNTSDKTKGSLKVEKDRPKSKSKENEKRRNSTNETDDRKTSKSKSRTKRRRSSSRSHSSRDPLTTKFEKRRRDYKQRSRSSDRLRERKERNRLQRRLVEEQRRSRDEMMQMQQQMQKAEKQREMEFRLEQERRKLQLERELFERERRELSRIDAERRKIEKERMELFQQRAKLEEDLQKNKLKRNVDEFNLRSTIVKPQRKEPPKPASPYRKVELKHQFERLKVENTKSSKSGKEGPKVLKGYERPAPPPPKLSTDFDLSNGRKAKHSEHKHEHDRKSGRKIEVIDRKYYVERGSESTDRRHERVYRKPEIPERKYEYGREVKRFREEGYTERDNTQRTQWGAAANYNDAWKPMSSAGNNASSAPARYQDGGNFPASSYGAAPSRAPAFYYHPTPQLQEYPRYEHCPPVAGRKY